MNYEIIIDPSDIKLHRLIKKNYPSATIRRDVKVNGQMYCVVYIVTFTPEDYTHFILTR